MRLRGTRVIDVFWDGVSSSKYVLRLVVMTRFVLRPERTGLTKMLTRKSAPLPLDVSLIIEPHGYRPRRL